MLGDIKEIKKNSEFIYLYNFGQLNLIECQKNIGIKWVKSMKSIK